MVAPKWKRLVRFIAEDDWREYIGEPVDETVDVGAALAASTPVPVRVFSGTSALDASAEPTQRVLNIQKLLPPLTRKEIGTIRCIGLNYRKHAKEMNLELPEYPTLFFKPASCLNASNAPLVIPHQATDAQADYEAELAVVIGRDARNVSVEDAMDYVLGYMCSNDVTGRKHQFAGAQWGFGKGFDGFAPMGPCLVSTSSIPDPSVIELKTVLNGEVMQEGRGDDMIFSIAEIVAYLSQGTTLEAGTVIMTGTPHGIGVSRTPPVFLAPGDDLRIVMSHGLGSLVNKVVYEEKPQKPTNGVNGVKAVNGVNGVTEVFTFVCENDIAQRATGYIGGDFLYAAYHAHPEWSFSALVRNQEKAAILRDAFPNIRPVLGDLDSTDVLREEASAADIVLHFADCDHEESARAFIEGLKLHSAERPGWYIHTSGTGILTVEDGRAKTCGTHRTKVYDDWDGVSELLNLPDDAFHRNVDKIVTDTIALPSKNFKTAIVCPCCIHGPGRGPGNTKSVQVYTLATTVLKRGQGVRIGDGENIWHQVHIQDLSNLYLALAEAAVSGGGKATWDDEGYYLAENGSFSWGDVERAVAQAAFEKGLIKTSELDVLDWDGTDKVDPASPYKWGSNSRGLATRARKCLGWKPVQPKLMDLIGDIVELQAKDLK
ncbi:fumarylacetoacetate hydrolase [Colletotrichum asianum]